MSLQNGLGTEYYPSGRVRYVGEFKDGIYHGTGKVYWETNGILMYEGELKDGDFNGYGTSYFSDGRLCHKGMFKDGRPFFE